MFQEFFDLAHIEYSLVNFTKLYDNVPNLRHLIALNFVHWNSISPNI